MRQASADLASVNRGDIDAIHLKVCELLTLCSSECGEKVSNKIIENIFKLLTSHKISIDVTIHVTAMQRLYELNHIDTARTVYNNFALQTPDFVDAYLKKIDSENQIIECDELQENLSCLLIDWCLRKKEDINAFQVYVKREDLMKKIIFFLENNQDKYPRGIIINDDNFAKTGSFTIHRARKMSEPIDIPAP